MKRWSLTILIQLSRIPVSRRDRRGCDEINRIGNVSGNISSHIGAATNALPYDPARHLAELVRCNLVISCVVGASRVIHLLVTPVPRRVYNVD